MKTSTQPAPRLIPDPATVRRCDYFIAKLNQAKTPEAREAIWQQFDRERADGTLKEPQLAAA